MSVDIATGMEGAPINDHTLSVIIPAYNEEQGIAAIIERVLAVRPMLTAQGVSLELLVVDDGSEDATAEIVTGYPEARLVQHSQNRGYGAALKTGFAAACGDWLGFMDADGTYPPEHFPALCNALDHGQGADLVVGSRRSGADSQMPLVRRVGNWVWSNLVTALGGQRVIDPASGMRVFRREALERLYPLPNGLNLTPVMSTRAIHEGVRLLEVPIPYTERQGRSKLNVVEDGMRFLGTIVWTVLMYNPARPLGGTGAGLFAIGAIAALGLIIARLAGVTELGPWGVFVAFVAALFPIVGFDLFALGATFNYLVSLFHERPVRHGLFGKPIFDPPLDRHFWWMGLLTGLAGILLGIISLALGVAHGWGIDRLWLYLLGGTVLSMLGLNLLIFWLIMRVLEELSTRRGDIEADLSCYP